MIEKFALFSAVMKGWKVQFSRRKFNYIFIWLLICFTRIIGLLLYDIYSIIFYETQIEFFIASNYENLLQNVDVW